MDSAFYRTVLGALVGLLITTTYGRIPDQEPTGDYGEVLHLPHKYDLCGNTTKCICINTVVRKAIQCQDGRMSGPLPSQILVPTDYTSVDFSKDSIPYIKSNVFDGTYVSLSVVNLDFSNNDIEYIEDGAFEMFQSLRELNLRRNKIENLTLAVFRGLRLLETLDLSYNNIARVDIDVLYPCISLRQLNLRYNVLPLEALQDLLSSASTNLESLDLHGLGLDTISDDLFRPVPYIETLFLSSNSLREVPGESLSRLRRLSRLDLSDNFIRQIQAIDFEGLESLEELYLDRMKYLEIIGEGGFRTLHNLRIFSCSFNPRLMVIHPESFPTNYWDEKEDSDTDSEKPNKWHLEEVHLRQNALNTLSESLLPWSLIRYVDLSENPWHCDCRLQWMKKIQWDMRRTPQIMCSSPRALRRRLIDEIPSNNFMCDLGIDAHVAASLILLLVTLMILVLGFSLFACWKLSWFNVCRATFQTRYIKLKSRSHGNNNILANDLEMNASSTDDIK